MVHIETGRHLYGGAQQVLYLLKGLRGGLFENHLVCPRASEIARPGRRLADCCHTPPMRGELDFLFGLRLLRLFAAIRPHIVHVHSRRGADLWGGPAGKIAGAKTVVTRRVDNPERPLGACAKYRMYDRVVAISREVSAVLERAGVPRGKVACIPSAVDADQFRPNGDNAWFRQEFGITPDQQTVGMIAQFIERKGHMEALQAFAALRRKCPETRLVFFGRGPLMGRIQEAAARMGLVEACIFAGFRNDLERILPCLDVVFHPARMEGLGVSLLQASASGVPVVAAPVGGIPEIVSHGKTGLLVPAEESPAMAEAVAGLLRERQWAHRLGRNGREKVCREFSIDAMVSGNQAVYRRLLAG